MYAVIFRAEINKIDDMYTQTAERMRYLAVSKYGCKEFTSVTEGKKEISISYWENKEQIRKWKENEEHINAQRLGHEKWYKSYKVEVVEVIRDYYR